MKINGKELTKQGIEIIVFPRKEEDIVFKAKPVTDYSDFEKLCPLPTPIQVVKPGGIKYEDTEHPDYKKALTSWAEKKTAWMIKESLSATEGLTWDTVNASDSSTWTNINKELSESGLSIMELQKLFEIVTIACGLTQEKIEEATKRFLAGQVTQ